MIYYFIASDGYLTSEDNLKHWYGKDRYVFTNRDEAIAEAKRRTKVRIAELKEYYEELECYRHTG